MNYKKLTDLEKNRVLDEVVAYFSLLEDKKRLAAQNQEAAKSQKTKKEGFESANPKI